MWKQTITDGKQESVTNYQVVYHVMGIELGMWVVGIWDSMEVAGGP